MSGKLTGKGVLGSVKKGGGNEINRGTSDEVEILALIVANHAGLRTIIFDRLRQAKARVVARGGAKKSEKAS